MRTDSGFFAGGDDATIALLRDILGALDASGASYALIHAGRQSDLSVSTDVDIATDRNPNRLLLPILRRLEKATGARLVHCLHYEIPHGYYYILRVPGVSIRFLHLDCLYDPLGVNRYRLPTPLLLDGVVAGPWGKQTRPEMMAIYLLLKRAMKGAAGPESIDTLRRCFDDASDALRAQASYWFGPRATSLLDRLFEAGREEQVTSALAQLRTCSEQRYRRNHPLRHLLSFPLHAVRKARRMAQPSGLFVVLIGPDGAGKSTVAQLVASRLERAFRKTWRFHWRPGLLPKLRRGGQAVETSEGGQPPPAAFRYGSALSLARFLYYCLDFTAGYWLRIHPRKVRSTLVIGERYFPDVLVDPRRYGFAVPQWLMRWAAACVPSPDLVVLLKDDPEVIFARKSETPPPALAEQIAAYEAEMTHWGATATVLTTDGAAAVADRVCELIVDQCAARTTRRLRRFEIPPWRAFPSAAGAKVWIGDDDGCLNALRLYHPYSPSGRCAKWVTGMLPEPVHRALFRDRPDAQTAERLALVARTIRETLGSDDTAISFAGTSGSRRKLTAQASIRGSVVCYVKSGDSDACATLLRHEAEFLAWLHRVHLTAASVPDVMAVKARQGREFLFLSPPARPGTPRPLEPDDKDARFLSELASREERNIALSEFLEADDWRAIGNAATRPDSPLAAILPAVSKAIANIFGRTGIRLVPSHGDYAPWNTLELADGSLFVFDWEFSSRGAPLLTDVFHRLLMPARLVHQQSPARLMGRLLRLHDDPLWNSLIAGYGISKAEASGYLLLYLVRLAVREASEQGTPSTFLLESLQRVLDAMPAPARRRNILVVAYACEPDRGSEPGVGWNMSQAISRENDAWVITRKNNRASIEGALAKQPNPHLRFHYTDLPHWASFWKRGGRGIRTYYYLWQFAAFLEARRLMRKVRFDLGHHVTFVNSYLFSGLGLVKLPFVWGPIGNHPLAPRRLEPSREAALRDQLRYGFQQLVRAIDPLYWICAFRARLIIGINPSVGRQFPLSLVARRKFASHTAIGVEEELLAVATRQHRGDGVRVLTMGQLRPVKGLHVAIRAFAGLVRNYPQARLIVVGDGPERGRLARLAAELRVAEQVEFVKWLPREEAMSKMDDADIFLFPSFEGGGMVVLEAMAHGLPVVCLDFGGPGEAVTSDCGFAVAVSSLQDSVSRLQAALETLTHDPALRVRMGAAARQRVTRTYLWKDRHRAIEQWYSRAMAHERNPGIESAALEPRQSDDRSPELGSRLGDRL